VTGAMTQQGRWSELLSYFLRLGLLGFGGPVALVGQMEREVVAERGWLSKEQMREAIAVCQSMPGPLAIQVGIYIAYLRGGFWGAWIGGWAFIFPNLVIVAALGALYVYLGDLKPVTAIFYGVSPAVIALILHSCYRLAKLGMEDWLQLGNCGGLPCGNGHPAGRSRTFVHRRRSRRHSLLRTDLAASACRYLAGVSLFLHWRSLLRRHRARHLASSCCSFSKPARSLSAADSSLFHSSNKAWCNSMAGWISASS
jgi:chromate transport protein ChrA